MAIKYVGIGSLEEADKFKLTKISEREFPKLTRHLPNGSLMLIIKKYSKTGKRHKYSLHAKIDDPDLKFKAESHEWDISKAAHKVFEKLEQEISHKTEIKSSKARSRQAKEVQ